MCGILAVLHAQAEGNAVAAELQYGLLSSPVVPSQVSRSRFVSEALYLLQHRGQDACGISTCAAEGKIYQCKGNGLASKVFRDGSRIQDLPG